MDAIQPPTSKKQKEILCFGDTATFFDNDHAGFLSATLSGSTFSSLTVSPRNSIENPGLGNFRTAVFQIVGKNKYKENKVFNMQLEKMRKRNPGVSDEQLVMEGGDKLANLKAMAESEDADNVMEQKRRLGDAVVYGQTVQLLHPLSGQFVRVSSNTTSKLEPSNMRVDLHAGSFRSSWFRIMPRYKVRAEGDPVRKSDQIVLESVKTLGQFLHAGAAHPDSHPLFGSLEINLSVLQTAFIVMPFSKPGTAHVVCGGDVVQLFHKEIGAYIAAEGVFTESACTQDVHMRVRLPDPARPSRLAPPTSCVTFWQIEHELPTDGGSVGWDQRIRLKHIGTQQYLTLKADASTKSSAAMDDDNDSLAGSAGAGYGFEGRSVAPRALTLTRDALDPDCLFNIHSVVRESAAIPFNSYCRIEHARSGCWLHAAKGVHVKRALPAVASGSPSSLAARMSTIAWDNAPLVAIQAIPMQNFDDAFIVQRVLPENVSNVGFVAGMLPIFNTFANVRRERELRTDERVPLESALGELCKFLFKDGMPVRERQKLLRNLRVIESLVDMLTVPFAPINKTASAVQLENVGEPEHNGTKLICNAVYKVFRDFLNGSSRKNELYLARHISFFQKQLGGYLDCEPVYTELLRDNLKIVSKIEEKEIAKIVDLLKKRKNHHLLEFLAILCVCDGTPLSGNQNLITTLLLEQNKGILYLTELKKQEGVVMLSTDGGRMWKALRDFAAEHIDKAGNASIEFQFLQQQLNLFGELVAGRNTFAADVIIKKQKYLTWDECFFCAQNERLPKTLRAMYVALIANLFVDVGDNLDVLADVQLNYAWERLSDNPYGALAGDATLSLSGARMPYFPQLSKFLETMVAQSTRMIASDSATNTLLSEILQLLEMLVRFGYYATPEAIKNLMIPLAEVADGFDDLPFSLDKQVSFATLRKDGSGEAEENSSEKAIKEWRAKGRYVKSADNRLVVAVKLSALGVIDAITNFIFTTRLQHFLHDFKTVYAYEGPDKKKGRPKSTRGSPALGEHLLSSHIRALQVLNHPTSEDDVYAQTEVVRHYMATLMSRTNWLAPGVDLQAQVIHADSDSPDHTLLDIFLDLAKYNYSQLMQRSMNLVGRVFTAQESIFEFASSAKIVIVPDSVAFLDKVNKAIPELCRIAVGFIERDADMDTFVQLLTQLAASCYLLPDDKKQNHQANQDILFNAEILDLLMDVLKVPNQETEVLQATFRMMRAVTMGQNHTQQYLFGKLDKILAYKSDKDGWQNDMAAAVEEIFANNQWTSLHVTAAQIEEMILFLVEHREYAYDMLDALRSIIILDELGIPLKRNQFLIIKALMQHRLTLIAPAHIDDQCDPEINKLRLDLLRFGSKSPESANLLTYHLKLVTLLAACAEGENLFIESMCQTIFSVEELMETIADPKIHPLSKVPYLQFFLWVYLIPDTVGNGTADLCFSAELFGSLEVLAKDVLGRAFSSAGDLPGRRVVDFVYTAFVPVVTSVVQKHYSKTGYAQAPQKMTVVTSVLSDFVRRASPTLTNPKEIKVLTECIIKLNSALPGVVPTKVSSVLAAKLESVEAGIMETPARRMYTEKFQDQQALNVDFKVFAANVAKAFTGRNTVAVQLGLPGQHNQTIEYCEAPGSDQALPLGLPFQRFVGLFVEPSGAIWVDGVKRVLAVIRSTIKYAGTLDAKSYDEAFELVRRFCQVIRAVIHNSTLLPSQADMDIRTAVANSGVVLTVADLLSLDDENVVREALALLAALLDDGNRAAQLTFEKHFLSTREETFFVDVQSRMRRSMESLHEMRALSKQLVEEAKRQRKRMGTMTLAGSLQVQTITALNEADGLPPVDPSIAASGSGGIEMAVIAKPVAHSRSHEPIVTDPAALGVKDEGSIELVLQVLQNMCEGHNRMLQDYLRVQPDNMRSIDLVTTTVQFLKELTMEIKASEIELVTQTLVTLVEFAQGCEDNQDAIFQEQVVDTINYLMRLLHWGDCTPAQVALVKFECAKLTLSLLEGSGPVSVTMGRDLDETLDLARLVAQFVHYYDLHHAGTLVLGAGEHAVDTIEVAMAFFHILKRLHDFTGKNYFATLCSEPHDSKVVAALEANSASIEILRDGQLQRIHFYQRWQDLLRPEVKEELLWQVERGSPSDKIRDFVERCGTIIADMAYLEKINANFFLRNLVRLSPLWKTYMLLMTVIINILILIDWRAPATASDVSPVTDEWFDAALIVTGILHIVAATLVFLAYFVVTPPSMSALVESIPFGVGAWLVGDVATQQTRVSPLAFMSLYHIAVLALSFAGIFFDGYFYCFHLLHVVVNNDILIRAVMAVTKNGASLIWVAALMVIIIYIYSLISFAFLRGDYAATPRFCGSPWECFVSTIREGLLNGGGAGDGLEYSSGSFDHFGWRVWYDLSYFIIITIIGLNVVFGIIVDTFSELRDEKYQIQEAMDSECFICSLKNFDFERFGNGFTTHVKKEHNMWNYLFYMLHLRSKAATDYTSHEQYFDAMVQTKREGELFPINHSMVLSNTQETTADKKLDNIHAVLGQVLEHLAAQNEREIAREKRDEEQAWKDRKQHDASGKHPTLRRRDDDDD